MIKKILSCLLLVFSINSAFAQNWIYLKSEAIETAITEMVRADLQFSALTQYMMNMDDAGRISVKGFYEVCYYSGFDIVTRDGYDNCQKMLHRIIELSGNGNSNSDCVNDLDGILTTNSNGKSECVGHDGYVLNYKNACTDTNTDANTKGLCIKRFNNANVQYAAAKSIVRQVFSKYNLTCKNQLTTEKNPGKYMYCSYQGKPFTLEFAGFKADHDSINSRRGIAEMLCRTQDQNYGAVPASHGDQLNGSVSFVCRNTQSNEEYFKHSTAVCAQIDSWGKQFGGYKAGKVSQDIVNVSDGVNAAKPKRGLCVITGGKVSQTSLINELAEYGLDSMNFENVSVRNSEDVIKNVREYARATMGKDNVKTIECDTTTRRMNIDVNVFGFATGTRDVLRCTINGKKIDFVFKSVSATGIKLKSGMQAMSCAAAGGEFNGEECMHLSKEQCLTLQKQNQSECPTCRAAKWDEVSGMCVLPDSKTATNIQRTAVTTLIIAGAVVSVALMPVTGGSSAYAYVLVAADVIGATIELAAQIKINGINDEFFEKANKCNDQNCAETLVKDFMQRLSNIQNDLQDQEIKAADKELARLIKMIPVDSELIEDIIINGCSSADRQKGFLDAKSWEPEQIWRAVGIALQLTAFVGSFFQKNVTKMNQAGNELTRLTRAQAKNLDDAAALFSKVDDQRHAASLTSKNAEDLWRRAKDINQGKNTLLKELGFMDGDELLGLLKQEAYLAQDIKDLGTKLDDVAKQQDNLFMLSKKGNRVLKTGRSPSDVQRLLTESQKISTEIAGKTDEWIALNKRIDDMWNARNLRTVTTIDVAVGPDAIARALVLETKNQSRKKWNTDDIVVSSGTSETKTDNTPEQKTERPDRIVGNPCADTDLSSSTKNGVYITGGSAKYDCWDEKKQVVVKCSCGARECKEPYVIARNSSGVSLGYCTKGGINECISERAGNPEGVACCYLKVNVATWDGTRCVCTESNKDFYLENGYGVCKLNPIKACQESGGNWDSVNGKCHCGTLNNTNVGSARQDKGMMWSSDVLDTGTCKCLTGWTYVDINDKSKGCRSLSGYTVQSFMGLPVL